MENDGVLKLRLKGRLDVSRPFLSAVENLIQVHANDVASVLTPLAPRSPRLADALGTMRPTTPRTLQETTPRTLQEKPLSARPQAATRPRSPHSPQCSTPMCSARQNETRQNEFSEASWWCSEPSDLPMALKPEQADFSDRVQGRSEISDRVLARSESSQRSSQCLPPVRPKRGVSMEIPDKMTWPHEPFRSPKTRNGTKDFQCSRTVSSTGVVEETLSTNDHERMRELLRKLKSGVSTVTPSHDFLTGEVRHSNHSREKATYEDAFVYGNGPLPWIPQSFLGKLVDHVYFEAFFAALILLNTVTIAVDAQYHGFDIGHSLGYPEYSSSEASWPMARNVLDVFDYAFGIMFGIEVTLKMMGMGWKFFKSLWNIMDTLIVIAWSVQKFFSLDFLSNPTLFRLCRLMRILRIVRLFRAISAMDSLHVLIKSIQASLPTLFWFICLLSLMLTSASLFVHNMLVSYFEDGAVPLEVRLEVFTFFGTFTRSVLSLLEVTLGNFSPAMRVLTENVDEQWGWFFVSYKCVGGFAVMTVITGVFLQETFKVASSDDDLLLIREKRQQKAHLKKMTRLFKAAGGTEKDGLDYDAFRAFIRDPFIRTWLAAYELEANDTKLLFRLLDDGDGKVTAEELVLGVSRLKGGARSIDVHTSIRDIQLLKDIIADMYVKQIVPKHVHQSLQSAHF